MALMALAQRTLPKGSRSAYVVGILGIFGASLFFGDSVITPAITVLVAVEGLEVAAPRLHRFIVPITVGDPGGAVRAPSASAPRRSARCSARSCMVWFLALAAIGMLNIVDSPGGAPGAQSVCGRCASSSSTAGTAVLHPRRGGAGGDRRRGAVRRHGPFRRASPIRYALVLRSCCRPDAELPRPGRVACSAHPAAVDEPVLSRPCPPWALYPMIVLATLAAVIASQAVITGAFSVARQAMQLGYLPRMQIKHTSHDTIGQIYVPWINWLLMIAVIALVLMFRSSTALASAYGVSVSGTMLIDTLLLALVARALWPRWRIWVLPLCVLFFDHRRRLPRRQRRQVLRRRLVPGGAGHRGVHAAAHLAPRPRAAARGGPQGRHPARQLPARPDAGAADARAGHGDLHDRRQGRGAARAAAQPQAQQGAARAQRVPDRGDAQRAARAEGQAPEDRADRRRLLSRADPLRLHGRRPTCRWR